MGTGDLGETEGKGEKKFLKFLGEQVISGTQDNMVDIRPFYGLYGAVNSGSVMKSIAIRFGRW